MAAATLSDRPAYPRGVPSKFSADGETQRYPGNTIVCHIPADSPIQPKLHLAYNAFKAHPTLGSILRLLPPSSWHMTVVEGVCEAERKPGTCPPGMETQPIDEITRTFSKTLREVGLDLEKEGLAPPYRMRVKDFGDMSVGAGFGVEGATPEEDRRVRRLRDRLADAMGFRFPNHDTYAFHVTVGYWLRHAEGDHQAELDQLLGEMLPLVKTEFELGAAEFCTFDDMCAFTRLFYIGKGEH